MSWGFLRGGGPSPSAPGSGADGGLRRRNPMLVILKDTPWGGAFRPLRGVRGKWHSGATFSCFLPCGAKTQLFWHRFFSTSYSWILTLPPQPANLWGQLSNNDLPFCLSRFLPGLSPGVWQAKPAYPSQTVIQFSRCTEKNPLIYLPHKTGPKTNHFFEKSLFPGDGVERFHHHQAVFA